MNNNSLTLKIIDGAIVVFFVLFLLSLSNSIFVNQIGIYITFLLILLRYAITRDYFFSKTGLELALILYIAVEIISASFSDYSSEAFNNVLKRILLIPIIYTTLAAITDFNRGKLYFKLYIAGTIITVLIYLYFSYYFLINNLYGQIQAGPSLFQYPITASEIISFTVIFLFAFLVNEKVNWKYRLLILIGFGLSCLALISTYKRTGWIGAAFGIFIILVMKKQWKILIAGFVIISIIFALQENISKVVVIEKINDEFLPAYSITTDGRAYDITEIGDNYVVSDFDNGLSIYKDSILIRNIKLPGPVRSFKHFTENYFIAFLEDTRFIALKRNNLELTKVNEFMSPGFTSHHKIANGFLYVIDRDSGLTVFTDPLKDKSSVRYPDISNKSNLFVDSAYIIFPSLDSGFSVYSLEGKLPEEQLFKNENPDLENLSYSNGRLLAAYPDGLYLNKLDSASLMIDQEFKSLQNIYKIFNVKEGFVIVGRNGNVHYLKFEASGTSNLEFFTQLDFLPQSVSFDKNKLYCSQVKRSRLLGIFDAYHPSNYSRLALWRAGWQIFKDNPLFGVGDIDLAKYYLKYKRNHDKEILGHMHNNFIHFLVTLGIFGLLVICFLFYKIIAINIRIIKGIKSKPFISSYAIGVLAAFCAALASGLTELNFWDQEITTLIYFTFGLNLALYNHSIKENHSEPVN
ncbi:MAG: O-antigen ligase family protein [Ignavibacteria bacterium]|jgi:hypothetical protein